MDKTDIYEKLRKSIYQLADKTKNMPTTNEDNSEISKLYNKTKKLKKQYDKLDKMYSDLLIEQQNVYEGLIGTAVLSYYVEFAYKYSVKLSKIISKLEYISEDSQLFKLINDLKIVLNNNYNERDIANILNKLKDVSNELKKDILNNQISAEYDENGNLKIKDNTKSRFIIQSNIKSGYCKFGSFIRPDLISYSSIYGTPLEDGSYDEIYITDKALGLNNVKLVRCYQKKKLCFIFNYTREIYRGIVYDDSNIDELYGVELGFKKGLFKFNSDFNSNIRRVNLKTGFYVDGITFLHSGGNDYSVNEDLRLDETDDKSLSVEKVLNTMKELSMTDDVKKPGKKGNQINFLDKNSQNDSVNIYSENAGFNLYKNNANFITRKVSLFLDRESLDYNNTNELCNSVSLEYKYEENSHKLSFSPIKTVKQNNKIKYNFTSSYSDKEIAFDDSYDIFNQNEMFASAANTIPLKLSITVDQTNKDINIEISLDIDKNIFINKENSDLYSEIGLLLVPNKQYEPLDIITDPNIISQDTDYAVAQSFAKIDVSNAHDGNLLIKLEEITDLFEKLRQYIFESFMINLNLLYKCMNTVSICDPFRSNIDDIYSDTYYASKKQDLSLLTNIIFEFNKTLKNLPDGYSNYSSFLISRKDKFNEIKTKIISIENQVKYLLLDELDAINIIDDIVETYRPIFKHDKIETKIVESLMHLFEIYRGDTDFTSTLSSIWLPLNSGIYYFNEWYSIAGNSFIYDTPYKLIKYYIFAIFLSIECPLKNKNFDLFKKEISKMLVDMIERNSIIQDLATQRLKDKIKLKNELINRGFNVLLVDKQTEIINTELTNKFPMLSELNKIQLNFSIKGKYIVNPETLNIFKAIILRQMLLGRNSIKETVNFCIKCLDHYSTLRDAITYKALIECIEKYQEITHESLGVSNLIMNKKNEIDKTIDEIVSTETFLLDPNVIFANIKKQKSTDNKNLYNKVLSDIIIKCLGVELFYS